MVLHDQGNDISQEIHKLDQALDYLGYSNQQAIHTEPLIRREKPYEDYIPNERRAIFAKLYYFTLNCEIVYKSFVFRKSDYSDLKKDFLKGIHKKEF